MGLHLRQTPLENIFILFVAFSFAKAKTTCGNFLFALIDIAKANCERVFPPVRIYNVTYPPTLKKQGSDTIAGMAVVTPLRVRGMVSRRHQTTFG